MSKTTDILSRIMVNTIVKYIENIEYDRTYQGRITQILADGKYEVEISGVKYTTYSSSGLNLSQNDAVWVTAPQNEFNNIYISGLRK